MLGKIVQDAKIEKPLTEIPEGIEVSTRWGKKGKYLFVQNFNRYPVEINLPVKKMKILEGTYDGSICSLSTIVLKEDIF